MENLILKKTDVVILCGGFGKRLKSILSDRPKPMALIDNRPFLDILIKYVASFGFKRFILCAYHLADVIKDYYAENTFAEILVVKEKIPLGTAGAIKNAGKFINSDNFLAMNGDCFSLVNLLDFSKFHLQKKAEASLVVTEAKSNEECGMISIDNNSRIIDFREKEKSNHSYINSGIYFLNKSFLENIPSNTACSLEYDVFPKTVTKQYFAYITSEDFLDIGTPEKLKLAQKRLKNLNY